MNQEYDNVDQFLRNVTFEVEDNGFSEQVMKRLPDNSARERRLQRIWQLVCFTAALIVGWWTNIIDVIKTDIKVFINTLPVNYDAGEMMISAFMILLLFTLFTAMWSKKIIY